MNENETGRGRYGADALTANVRGDDITALKLAALDAARKLYGDEAPLRIEEIEDIRTSIMGGFRAYVTVRCERLPEDF